MIGWPTSALGLSKPKSSSQAGLTPTLMPSCTSTMASLERCSAVSSSRRASRADLMVVLSTRSSRKVCSSRAITACRRSGLASETTSRAPARSAAAMRSSSTVSAITTSGTAGAMWSRTLTVATRLSWPQSTYSRSSGLSCVRASPRSRSDGIQVQCTGCPARRKMLLIVSTGSRATLSTINGTAVWSFNPLSLRRRDAVQSATAAIRRAAFTASHIAVRHCVRRLSKIPGKRPSKGQESSSGAHSGSHRAPGPQAMGTIFRARIGLSGIIRGPFGAQLPDSRGEDAMASYSTSEFRSGMKIILDGDPYSIVENEMVKPGKGQAFNRVKVRNLKTGRTIERTFKSGETVEAADVVDTDMQYLYQDGEFWHFMVPESFEQYTAGKSAVGDGAQWLKDGVVCIVTLWNNVPLLVTPPAHIELTVTETDPGLRGDTATGGQKVAKLETGAVVRVPLFINEGELIRVDTRTGAYISRAKQ